MKHIQPILFLVALHLCALSEAQKSPETGYYQVVQDSFSPPIRDLVTSFEGFPATPFLANDMNQNERNLGDFRGTVTLLYFWNIENVDAVSMLYDLNQLKKKYENKVTVVAMSEDSRSEVEAFLGTNEMEVIIIPNTKMLGEAVYGDELGCPRLFVIDQSGVIRTVIPEEFFAAYGNHEAVLEGVIKSYME